MLQEASLFRRHTSIPGYKVTNHCWGDIAGICGDCRYVFWSGSSPGTWAAAPETKTGHVTPPSCFVDRKRVTFHTSRNKVEFKANETSKSVHSCDRLVSEVSSHQPTLYLASKNAREGHWDSACRFTSAHGRGKNRSDRLADAVLCAGAAAHGSRKESQFGLLWNFAWDQLASRIYAAPATTFLMKICFYSLWTTRWVDGTPTTEVTPVTIW